MWLGWLGWFGGCVPESCRVTFDPLHGRVPFRTTAGEARPSTASLASKIPLPQAGVDVKKENGGASGGSWGDSGGRSGDRGGDRGGGGSGDDGSGGRDGGTGDGGGGGGGKMCSGGGRSDGGGCGGSGGKRYSGGGRSGGGGGGGGKRGQRLRPDNWGSMTKPERESWKTNAKKKAKGKRPKWR